MVGGSLPFKTIHGIEVGLTLTHKALTLWVVGFWQLNHLRVEKNRRIHSQVWLTLYLSGYRHIGGRATPPPKSILR